MVRLIKALYGHPESGAHWERHFEDILQKHVKAEPVESHRSTYLLPKEKLMLTVYVDDLLLAGPKGNHKKFWETLSKHADIEEVTSLERFLGRLHKATRTGAGGTISYDMSDYASRQLRCT